MFGGYAGLANMVIFLFLVNYIAALFVRKLLIRADTKAVQLFRGDIPVDADNITFSQQYSSFLGMYQVRGHLHVHSSLAFLVRRLGEFTAAPSPLNIR